MRSRKTYITLLTVMIFSLFYTTNSWAALDAYLKLKGAIQGDIKGGVTQKGREGLICVHSFGHSLDVPIDPATGLASGKRSHKPLKIFKEVDKSSPLLYRALIMGENITEFKLDFWEPSPTGAERQYFTIRLYNARIINISANMPNNLDPDQLRLKECETITFSYQRIVWIYQDGGITTEDDWQEPIQ